MENTIKGAKAWAVVGADPRSDEPGYLAYVHLFADKEEARQCLRNSADQDAQCFDDKIDWHDRDTDSEWCEVYCGGVSRVVYTLEELEIK